MRLHFIRFSGWCLLGTITPILGTPSDSPAAPPTPRIERITTGVPYPRGLALVDDTLYVLARGRSREVGGASAEVNDHAGTIYAVNPRISENWSPGPASERIRNNASVIATPSSPPFRLWCPEDSSYQTDRPYCALRYHAGTRSFYLCAFSGIDMASESKQSFVKHHADAILRYDLRTSSWHELDRHDPEAGWKYPSPAANADQGLHGWMKGPDNCLPLGNFLYAVAKDNSLLVRYPLRELTKNPGTRAPAGEVLMTEDTPMTDGSTRRLLGQSALAYHEGYLYIGYRTSSAIIRIAVKSDGTPYRPIRADFIAQFEPFDPETRKSANITDIAFDTRGRLHVLTAQPARVWRFQPSPAKPYQQDDPSNTPWIDMAQLTQNPKMKSENILLDAKDRLYITAADAYNPDDKTHGSVYRVTQAK